jgi:hypothetical protein
MFDKKVALLNFDIKIFNKWNLSEVLLFTGISIAILWSVYYAFVTISVPYQIEYHEGVNQVQTSLFLRRANPFTLENQPLGMTNYGMGYGLAVLPFAAVFGNTLLVHRSVTFGFIIFSALIGFFIVYRSRKDKLAGLACAAFIMVGLMTGNGIGAFPSAQATFLFLSAIAVPYFRSFDKESLIISALATLGAFYTKPYFILSFGTVVSYLFLFVSKKKGVYFSLFFFTVFVLLLLTVKFFFPTYFIDTVLGNFFNSWLSLDHLLSQLKEMFLTFLPILLAVFLIAEKDSFIKQPGEFRYQKNFFELNVLNWDRPLLAFSPNYLFYSFVCSFLAFVFILGWHKGTGMLYSYQLIVPLFLCWFFGVAMSRAGIRLFLVMIVLANLFIWEDKLLNPSFLKQSSSDEWAQLFDYIRSSKNILNAPTVVSEVIELGLTPQDSGQTMFFYNIRPYPENILTDIPYKQIRADGLQFENSINRRIEKQVFDLIITVKDKNSFYDLELVEKYYSQVSEISVYIPNVSENWTMLVWKPRSQ